MNSGTRDLSPSYNLLQRRVLLGALVLASVVSIAYFIAVSLSFVGDDWIFYELAGRLSLVDYLIKYFDPRVQTAWYRPVQGILFRIGYDVFGTNPIGYHLVNILYHLADALVLFILVGRLTRWLVGFVAGLLFATFPIAVEGVFKTGVIDPVTGLFFLVSIWFWLDYLRKGRSRDYILAFSAFLIALLSKEIAVTLPVTLFLLDRFVSAKPASFLQLLRRYLLYLLVWIVYLPIMYIVTQRSVFVHREGYQPSLQVFSNVLDYLAGLAFPWGFLRPLSYVWLVLAAGLVIFLILFRKRYVLIPIIVGAVLAFLPIVPFPAVSFRFLYVPLAGSAVLFALLFYSIWQHLPPRAPLGRALLLIVLAFVAATGSAQVSTAAADFSEYARVSRLTFRNFRQAHPSLPDDTLIYFVNPPLPGPNLSGMFFWYYGSRVKALADDSGARAGLREHAAAYVGYFDASGNQKEQQVAPALSSQASPGTPVEFGDIVRLEGWELASGTVKSGDSILLFLYWRGLKPMNTDYVVSAELMDEQGRTVAKYAKAPRRGDAPTSGWIPGDQVVDVLQIAVSPETTGTFRLELSLVDPGTLQRVPLKNSAGDKIVISPVSVTP